MSSYYNQLKELAESIGSDGCTGVLDIHVECCWEHDWTYVTGMTPQGVSVTKEYADMRFRDCIQAHVSLRWLSPRSWIRYVGVVVLGSGIWGRKIKVNVMNFYRDEDFIKKQLNAAHNSRLRILTIIELNP